MFRLTYGALALTSLVLAACSSDGSDGVSSGGGASGVSGAPSHGGAANGSSGAGPSTPPGSEPTPMPIISHGVPIFATNGAMNAVASDANDGKPTTRWSSAALPASLALDLSGVPADKRHQVLIAWTSGSLLAYINAPPGPDMHLPSDYLLEINSGAGGGSPPADGWVTVATITGNDRSTRQRLVDLDGGNWVRMTVTRSSHPQIAEIELDVHSAPEGATDSWLFMGDSITFLSTTYLFSDLPALVNADAADRWPAIAPAAIGGTNTTTAMAALQDTLLDFPGRFVTLNYGTNDHANDYHAEELAQTVIAAGKVPVIPHMPWSADANVQVQGPLINAQIDALYAKYPEIRRGPDLWAALENHAEWIPMGDVHPTDAGREEIRKQWASSMTR